jgi:hypothetical protein
VYIRKGKNMGIFSKYEYKKIELPFYYIREKEDIEAGGFSIEAYGEINGQTQYFYASFILSDCRMYDNGDYNEMISILESAKNNSVELELKIKKGEIKGFTIDAKSLAHSLEDSRFEKIEAIFWNWGKESRKNKC